MYIEEDPSGRATCNGCNELILKGSKRLVKTTQGYRHEEKYYYCKKCGTKVLQTKIDEYQELIMELLK